MTPKGLVTPKFLTVDMAMEVCKRTLDMVIGHGNYHDKGMLVNEKNLHLVVLVPAMKDDREKDYPDWPNYTLQPHCLFEFSVGKTSGWQYPFDDIARCKALQLWHDRNDDRTDCIPHLLFPGDTPYWGGVKRHGIVVTCSGMDPWWDKMLAGVYADMLIAHAYDAWIHSDDRSKQRNFME